MRFEPIQSVTGTRGPEDPVVERAFGAENRARLLNAYFDQAGELTPANAWLHVYQLFQWIDATIGLAHCYDSNHSQPGKAWYERTRRFHGWLAENLGCPPIELRHHIDWLFRHVVADLARAKAAIVKRQLQLAPDYPSPGDDSGLVDLLRDELGSFLARDLTEDEWRRVSLSVHAYVGEENKRNNLTGEGFEDALAAIIRRLPGHEKWIVGNRVRIDEIPKFSAVGADEKDKMIDVALWTPDEATRVLVTSKWSVKADREEQFGNDFSAYARANRGRPFIHTLITNEFDPARLKRACESVVGNSLLFHKVVHVNPQAVVTAYGTPKKNTAGEHLPELIESGRLISLEHWLRGLLE
jgi:hypothetical protein